MFEESEEREGRRRSSSDPELRKMDMNVSIQGFSMERTFASEIGVMNYRLP